MTNDNDTTVDVSISLRGNVDPDDVDARTGIARTRGCKKGERFWTDAGAHNRSFGLWLYSTEGNVDATDMNVHLRELHRVIMPVRHILKEIASDTESEIRLRLWANTTGAVVSIALDPKLIADLCLIVDGLDISVVVED